MADYRIEKDSMGEMRVPADALYAAQTQRAVENFPVSGLTLPRAVIRALGLIKAAAARSNKDLGLMKADMAAAIQKAANEVARGDHDRHFPIDIFQTGCGTSSNMNANEVIARLAGKRAVLFTGGGKTRAAAYWLQVASRLQPRDWRYHWYLGQFWQGQAFAGGGANAVRFALREFDAGLRANPLEVSSLLGRISTYRLLGKELPRPASASQLEAWSSQALAMAPLMPQVRRERARVLAFVGKTRSAGDHR